MSSKFSFARAVAVALVAIGSVASYSTDAFAVNRTWTPVASGTTSARWGTATVYAPNWSGSVNPTSADTGIFSSASNRTVTTLPNTLPIGKLDFSGAGSTTFTNTANSVISISGDGGTPNVGINSTSTTGPIFNGKVLVNAPQLTFQSTAGALTFGGGGVDLAGNYLKVAGNATQGSLGSSVAGGIYEVVSGTQTLTFDSTTGGNIASVVVNGGVASGDGNSATDLSIAGGTYKGGGVYHNVSSTSGLANLSAGETLSTNSFTQSAGGTLRMNVNNDLTSSTVNGNYQLGGAFQLDASNLSSNLYSPGTTWGLFSGVNFTSGTASPANGASNFSSFAMTASSSTSPYYGTFTRFGQEWYSPKANDGTFLVFQAASGNLVVVPEPSTMVFAGLGVAMSGWTMWKKRRLGKLLAAKAG